jgi:3',5'-cyclic AMP phosphodiesterase CpdA
MDVTTVADDHVVMHDATTVRRFDGLEPASEYELDGVAVRTLPRPPGHLLSRIATVNDVHFGEVECGQIDDHPLGPILRSDPGDPPYPETMNSAAADEIDAASVDAVFVKGDLTSDGTPEQFAAFERCYRERFAARLYVVRGNHDSYLGQDVYAGDQAVDLPGVTVALLDTAWPTRTTGRFTAEQAEWLDEIAATADRPVLVLGHHQNWTGGTRSEDYFGIDPDGSDRLAAVIARRPSLIAYAAGHTHRHRVRHVADTGDVPFIEVGCVKDFPGTWAEYRVYEGGVLQIVHRVSSAKALSWSERCRHLYADFGIDYESYALGTLNDRCFPISLRS